MTLEKLLERVKRFFETTYPDELLAEWAAEMDGRILKEDYLRGEFEIFYDAEADKDTDLLLREPWTNLYDMWLLQKIHFYRGEYDDAQNFEAAWNAAHKGWLKNILMTRPVDVFGRPWLTDVAFVRRGSDGVVHMHSIFREEDIYLATVYLMQGGEVKAQIKQDSGQMLVENGWITVHFTAEDTALLEPGSARCVTKIETVAGEKYESDTVQIRVLKSVLEEAGA